MDSVLTTHLPHPSAYQRQKPTLPMGRAFAEPNTGISVEMLSAYKSEGWKNNVGNSNSREGSDSEKITLGPVEICTIGQEIVIAAG
jgi:hypothetical protein